MEETVLLNFEIDQGEADRKLIELNKAILNNKEAQAALNKEYKAGKLTQEEYVKENINLQAHLKKNQEQLRVLTKSINTESNSRNALKLRVQELVKEYDNLNIKTEKGAKRAEELQKELKDLNKEITKTSKSAGLFKDQIGNYPEQLKNAAQGINVAGVSVGDLSTKLASFANPATAAIGIVTALGAAYARSTLGAKDLEFAQNQLSAATTIVTNKFAGLFTSAEDGEGALTSLLNFYLKAFSNVTVIGQALKLVGVNFTDIAKESKEIAMAAERLQDLQREEIDVRARISDRLETNQELLVEINDSQTDLNRQLELSDQIEKNLILNKAELLDVLIRQSQEIATQLAGNKDSEELQTKQKELAAEINKESAALNKRIAGNDKLQSDINDKLREEIRLRGLIANIDRKLNGISGGPVTSVNSLADPDKELSGARKALAESQAAQAEQTISTAKAEASSVIDIQTRLSNDIIKINRKQEAEVTDNKLKEAQLRKQIQQSELDVTAGFLGAAASLFDEQSAEYKALATAETLISTYSTAQKAYEAAFVPPTPASPGLGTAFAALAVVQGLANVARINGVQFAEGGFTGSGFGQPDHTGFKPAGYVHEHEYVSPKWLNETPAGAYHVNALEQMRTKGYADGGFVTNRGTSEINNSMLVANAMKNMPPIFASWKEAQEVGKKVEFKQNRSKI